MPPVRVMGHCCQAECPTSEAITCRAIAACFGTRSISCRANSLRARCGHWEHFVQAAERYPLRLVPERLAYRT
jgi:hypothetical protein